MFENVDVNSAGDIPCREKKKRNKETTPFLHVHGAKHVPLWAVPKMLRVFVRILATPSPEVLSRCKVDTTLLQLKNKNQLDATYYFIVLLVGSTCFGHYYARHQELATIMLSTTLVVSILVCCRLEVRCG